MNVDPSMLLQIALVHSFLWLNNILHTHTHTHTHTHYILIHSSFTGNLDCFHVLAIVNSTIMSIGVHVSFEYTVVSKYIPMSGTTGSDGSYIFSFLCNLHTILHNGCTNIPTNSVGLFLFVHPLWSIYYF